MLNLPIWQGLESRKSVLTTSIQFVCQ
ncbi:hypothetical protein VCHENC02_1102A, partial [Vibrio harveyi]